jgi:predicted transcriptional regulator
MIIFFGKIIPIRINTGLMIVIFMFYELNNIQHMRHKVGLTQSELAKIAKVSQSLITKIERGKIEPSYKLAKKIFEALEKQMSAKHKTIVAKDICIKNIKSIEPHRTIAETVDVMIKYAISQMPVVKDNVIIGSISEETFIKKYDKIESKYMKVEDIMDDPFPSVPENTNISLIREILKSYPALIITKKGKRAGIVSRADLLNKL